jgi:hypothetical protein
MNTMIDFQPSSGFCCLLYTRVKYDCVSMSDPQFLLELEDAEAVSVCLICYRRRSVTTNFAEVCLQLSGNRSPKSYL